MITADRNAAIPIPYRTIWPREDHVTRSEVGHGAVGDGGGGRSNRGRGGEEALILPVIQALRTSSCPEQMGKVLIIFKSLRRPKVHICMFEQPDSIISEFDLDFNC